MAQEAVVDDEAESAQLTRERDVDGESCVEMLVLCVKTPLGMYMDNGVKLAANESKEIRKR